jgi:branched-chain amino acid transport system permease protein
MLLGVVVTIGVVGAVTDPATRQQAMQLCTYIVLVCGLSILVSNSGITSFGHMAFATFGAYLAAFTTASPAVKEFLLPGMPEWLRQMELPTYVGVPVAVALTVAFAGLVAFPFSRLNGVAASISTLSLLAIIYNVARSWEEVTGGTGSFPGIPLSSNLWAYVGLASLAVTIGYLFERSKYGLKLQASRDDEPGARAIGVRIPIERQRAFVLSAAVMALGGAMFSQLIGVLSPNTLYLNLTFLTIAMLVIGGVNSLSGAVVGTTVVYLLNQLLREVEADGIGPIDGRPGMTEFILALFLLLVMIRRPEGLVGGTLRLAAKAMPERGAAS